MAKTLHDMLLEELRDIYSAETQIVRALPKMVKAATSPELKKAFETHLEQTRHQVERLDDVFEALDARAKTRGRKCEAMEGLLAEAEEILDLGLSPEAQDSALIASAQKVEHYEIASYGTAIAWAKAMKHDDAVAPLAETLDEERKTDDLLNKLSSSINRQAAGQAHPAHA
jgi:ferritin-like metal-binding protein YciE